VALRQDGWSQHVTCHVFVETTHLVAAQHEFACVVIPPT